MTHSKFLSERSADRQHLSRTDDCSQLEHSINVVAFFTCKGVQGVLRNIYQRLQQGVAVGFQLTYKLFVVAQGPQFALG